jgi:hypothetical protein
VLGGELDDALLHHPGIRMPVGLCGQLMSVSRVELAGLVLRAERICGRSERAGNVLDALDIAGGDGRADVIL